MTKGISVQIRTQVYKRDNNTCQYCGKKGIRTKRYGRISVVENPENILVIDNSNDLRLISFEIDHVIPKGYGGSNDIDNLKLSCRKCNHKKGFRLLGVSYG